MGGRVAALFDIFSRVLRPARQPRAFAFGVSRTDAWRDVLGDGDGVPADLTARPGIRHCNTALCWPWRAVRGRSRCRARMTML